jgi:hypothetical protein
VTERERGEKLVEGYGSLLVAVGRWSGIHKDVCSAYIL